MKDKIKGALLGIAIGDALGVPVEFKSRAFLKQHPVKDMIGFGTHDQKPGTWSDDASLSFCQVEALISNLDLKFTASLFLKWLEEGFWSARGEVFDVGNTTIDSLYRFKQTGDPYNSGGVRVSDNGNGSLMRILPVTFAVVGYDINERFRIVSEISSITHGHIRSIIACFYFTEYCLQIIEGKDKFLAYKNVQHSVVNILIKKGIDLKEIEIFHLDESEISSSGYVVSSLEASMWSFLRTENFKDAVLKSVNLGEDTDTIGSITGGIAGLYYGNNSIPVEWIEKIARKEDIIDLSDRLIGKFLK
jgi:ADP-ribosyl-[dinitrogen reductase] hydrolase